MYFLSTKFPSNMYKHTWVAAPSPREDTNQPSGCEGGYMKIIEAAKRSKKLGKGKASWLGLEDVLFPVPTGSCVL